MADTAVAITPGSGVNIDTRTEGTNGNHRQVVVIGDPATNAGVAPVDALRGVAVYGVGASTGTIASVNDTNADVTILAANADRKGAAVFNDSTALLYLALANVTASATNYSVQIPAGGYFELPPCDGGVYTGVIKGIWASDASGAARVTEWT